MLKEDLGSLDMILIMFKGTDDRFSEHTLKVLNLYQEVLGEEMWKNVVVEISFWGHKKNKFCDRTLGCLFFYRRELITFRNAWHFFA